MKTPGGPFWIALQFLSSLPVRLPGMPSAVDVGRSVLWYPLVGLIFAGVLCLWQALLAGVALPLQAALLLSLWVVLSGALHLDGLADSADAWLGGFGDPARTLAIMKDPRSGPLAVVTLVLSLLLKFCALWALLDAGQSVALALCAAPVLGRMAVLLLFLTTPYVRPGGLGQALAAHLPRRPAWRTLAGCALAILLLGGGWGLMVGLSVFWLMRRAMRQRLGGTTGDTAGALVEWVELAVLLAFAL